MLNNLTFFITQRCNKKCEYCDIPTIKNPKDINIDLFLKYINQLNKTSYTMFSLTGGEPGLLSEEILDIIFKNIKKKIKVNTNGLFFEKDYHNKWKNKISLIAYHVLDGYKLKEYNGNVIYTKVVHKNNIEIVKEFYNKYKYLNLDIKVYEEKRKDLQLIPSIDDLKSLNIVIPERKSNIPCFTATKEIDFVEGNLLDCCVSYTGSGRKELTEENLKIFINHEEECKKFHSCNSCFLPNKYYSTNLKKSIINFKKREF